MLSVFISNLWSFSLLIILRFATSKDRDKYVMTNLRCRGNETTIEDCDYRKFDRDSRNKAAGVECHGKGAYYELSISNIWYLNVYE